MLQLRQHLRAAHTAADREMIHRQIGALVYELYGLTEEEIVVVKGRLDHESRENK